MKTVKLFLIVLMVLTLTSCSWCQVEVIKEKKIYIDREVEVFVDVPCVVPDVNCSSNGSDGERIAGMLMCIVDLKRANEVCQHD